MVNKRKYTVNIHANRLRTMLRRDDWHFFCPAGKYFDPGNAPTALWDVKQTLGVAGASEPCRVCRTFVDLPTEGSCPCLAVGRKDALKRTKKALRRHYGTSNAKNN